MNAEQERMEYKKRGYLYSDYRIFYLKDTSLKAFDFHYHDFHKILIFLGGNVSYIVEGCQYDLHPGDILLIPAGEIHKPIIHGQAPYERMILYLSPRFFEENSSQDTNLFYCFETAQKLHSSLLRAKDLSGVLFPQICQQLKDSLQIPSGQNATPSGQGTAPVGQDASSFGANLYQKLKVLECLILLNRTLLTKQADFSLSTTAHPVVLSIMKYINNHITEDLSISDISSKMFLNRSYIMHLFKAETGFTIGQYITKKRLFLANQYRNQGLSVTEACYKSGFRNYSAYYHASRQESS